MMNRFLHIIFFSISVFFVDYVLACEHKVFAPTTYYSRQDGDWATNGTWSTVSHAGASCTCNPGCSPAANSTIRIAHVVTSSCATLELASNVTLIVESGGSFTLNGGGSLTGTGTLTIDPGGLMTVNGNVTLSGAGSTSINGTLNVYGTITDLNGGNSVCGTGTINVTTPPGAGTVCGTVVLPVTFTKFYIEQKDKSEELYWQTASEQNNRVFEIERSVGGIEFEKIGEHRSKADNQGNSNSLLDYVYEDSNPISGFSYYRLKQIDYNNNFKYSNIVSVDFEISKQISFIVIPNPNKGEFSVDFKGIENNHEIIVTLVDMNGKIIYETIVYPENISNSSFKIIPDVALPSGKYLVRMKIEGVSHTVKMIVE